VSWLTYAPTASKYLGINVTTLGHHRRKVRAHDADFVPPPFASNLWLREVTCNSDCRSVTYIGYPYGTGVGIQGIHSPFWVPMAPPNTGFLELNAMLSANHPSCPSQGVGHLVLFRHKGSQKEHKPNQTPPLYPPIKTWSSWLGQVGALGTHIAFAFYSTLQRTICSALSIFVLVCYSNAVLIKLPRTSQGMTI